MIIRTLTINDYVQYLSLINEFRTTHFSNDQFIEVLNTINKNSEIWVVEDNDELIATGTILYEHKMIYNICMYAHVEDICVKKNFRRRGIGKQLLEHLIIRANNKHCYKLTLNCSDDNINFYEACGMNKRGNQMCILF